MSARLPADIVSVRYYGGAYIARFRGKTASCTSSDLMAAEAAVRKVLGRIPLALHAEKLDSMGVSTWHVVAQEASR